MSITGPWSGLLAPDGRGAAIVAEPISNAASILGAIFSGLGLTVVRQVGHVAKVRPFPAAAPIIDEADALGERHESQILASGRKRGPKQDVRLSRQHLGWGSRKQAKHVIIEAKFGELLRS